MILTDYYLMREIKPLKSHRFDCTASTGEYPPFEAMANRGLEKRFFCYCSGVPDSFSANVQRKADRAITNSESISSIFIPDLENSLYGYGDTKGTNDALLFLFSQDYKQLEIFIARGYKNNVKGLFQLFCDGELFGEMEHLRKQLKGV